MTVSVRQKILRNTTFNAIAKLFRIPVYLLMIPYIVNHVGATRYGIWIAVFAFVDYFSLLDLGFGAAAIKYTAGYNARKDIFSIGQIVLTAVLFNSLIIPIVITLILFSGTILNFFNIEPEYLSETFFVFNGVLIIFAFNQITSVFRNVLIGLQRIDIQNLCDVANTLLYAIGVILVLSNGFGLKGLLLLVGALRCLLVFSQVLFVFRVVPGIKSGLRHFNAMMFKDFFRYGIKLQFTSIAGLINFQLDKLLIGYFLRLDFVTFYELGSKIAMVIRMLPSFLLAPLIPASAELATKGDDQRLETLHMRGTKYIAFIAAPLASFLIVMAPVIMSAWLGTNDNYYACLSLRILSIGYFFNIITSVITSIGRGIGVLDYEMYATALIASANLILSVTLIITIGFAGALIGTSISMIFGNIIYLYRFNNYLGISFSKFLKYAFFKPVFSSVVAGAILHTSQNFLFDSLLSFPANRMTMIVYLGLTGVIFFIIYSIGLLVTGSIKSNDYKVLGQVIASIRPALWKTNIN